jgi:hypothetical protein
LGLLGASQGIVEGAREELDLWYKVSRYQPTLLLDTETHGKIEKFYALRDGSGEQSGCKVWDGPLGPVIVIRQDGRPTYAYHDLVFKASIKPSYYITGEEQRGHFESLGLGESHLPMGLVLGNDGAKIKSRDGNAFNR